MAIVAISKAIRRTLDISLVSLYMTSDIVAAQDCIVSLVPLKVDSASLASTRKGRACQKSFTGPSFSPRYPIPAATRGSFSHEIYAFMWEHLIYKIGRFKLEFLITLFSCLHYAHSLERFFYQFSERERKGRPVLGMTSGNWLALLTIDKFFYSGN